MATFENCEIFSTNYFLYVRGYKVTPRGVNKSPRSDSEVVFCILQRNHCREMNKVEHENYFKNWQ